uniref:Uncharacterized protein n=1 Tax=Physcomitrium patens TaxID=3218 RepID=A0A7I4ATW6_PHYPA
MEFFNSTTRREEVFSCTSRTLAAPKLRSLGPATNPFALELLCWKSVHCMDLGALPATLHPRCNSYSFLDVAILICFCDFMKGISWFRN